MPNQPSTDNSSETNPTTENTESNEMKPTVMLPPQPDRRWTIAKQLGIDTAVVRFWGVDQWWEYDTLMRTTTRFADHGFS